MEPPKDIAHYWKTVMDTVQEGLMIVSPEGRILSVNRSTEEITGYSAEEMIENSCTLLNCTGCKFFGLGPGTDWCQLYQDGSVQVKKCLITHKDGHKVHVIKRASVLRDDQGQVIGAVESLSDISDVVQKDHQIVSLRRSLEYEDGFHGLVGSSRPMHRLYDLIDNSARSQAPVLIHGESGTGKELVARAIHNLGPRSNQPFIKVNCASLNENLLESELFGHVRGAFTGADRDRMGRFEAAQGGDILLDEIGDIPPATQVKLLRVLQEKEIERVGDHRPHKVDVRIITATNRDLSALIREERFREDLFYRINVVPIRMPALRERREDIPLLAQTFMDRLTLKTGRPIESFSPEAMKRLYTYTWPGNVRELKNAIEYAFVLCAEGQIKREHLPEHIAFGPGPQAAQAMPDVERERLKAALRETKGNQTQAAKLLGVSRMTVWKRMKKYGLSIDRDVK